MPRLQRENFDVGKEICALTSKNQRTGAAVSFLGVVRDFSRGEDIEKLDFEHYPGMAEKQLEMLETKAMEKFDILDCLIIHRTGVITVNENIVLIIAISMHRRVAFRACEWMINTLKKNIPIWKKEFSTTGKYWVEDHP
ncbi:MAG TPA: molybdenum cofactor biosynthesis protein MoaE [Nitrospinota bacterium]|jgi:molybdopterin synthase catalytic subunit|nr:molybdenum cofactor biosynthesis protein MoaE [Nitrospinota bacterium]|tara:strand:- start:155452 stop:155868 length:417 start_codon:yes stop_codon:yes gene_type:complete